MSVKLRETLSIRQGSVLDDPRFISEIDAVEHDTLCHDQIAYQWFIKVAWPSSDEVRFTMVWWRYREHWHFAAFDLGSGSPKQVRVLTARAVLIVRKRLSLV
jgi:hypothetical protein